MAMASCYSQMNTHPDMPTFFTCVRELFYWVFSPLLIAAPALQWKLISLFYYCHS